MAADRVSVLLVEDDPAIAQVYAYKLRLDGYEVRVATDPTAAEEAFRSARPAVACVDARLPGRPGEELAQAFAAQGTLVMLLTNDQLAYEKPPPGVARALIKARTTPRQLSAAIAEMLQRPA